MASAADNELDSFRRRWQEEVLRRGDVPPKQPRTIRPKHTRNGSKESSLAFHLSGPSGAPAHDEEGNYGTYDFDDLETQEASKNPGGSGTNIRAESIANHEPISALDHYEMAVVRETESKLGESLDLYRRAFRLDDCVDQIYQRKHFPASSFKVKAIELRSILPVTTSKEAPKSYSTVSALVALFAEAPILGALPMISGDIPPPCFIKGLPGELLIDILEHIAHIDLAALSYVARVSKRFAFLVTTQDSIWKRLVHGPRFGMGGMHYSYSKEISGANLELSLADLSLDQSTYAPRTLCTTLPLNTAYPTYRHMFQHRPRIRFSGVYISTVNYTRAGASGPNTLTWSTPIHVVTYYRYLRFYRDGSCISLLTTTEPVEVVPYLQKENIGGDFIATTTLPIGVMRDARRGRWKLGTPQALLEHEVKQLQLPDLTNVTDPTEVQPRDSTDQSQSSMVAGAQSSLNAINNDPEGILTLETEGPTPTYQYTARFELQSSGKNTSVRNTKLVWRGFWSHNLISGDWAEFGLKNDRAFVWSRVKSWSDA